MKMVAESLLQEAHPEVKIWVESACQQLKNAETKIQALTLELAYLRRIQFGRKSEALPVEQRQLFGEGVAEDIAAIEATSDAALPAPVPDVSPCRITCRASNTATSRRAVAVASAVKR